MRLIFAVAGRRVRRALLCVCLALFAIAPAWAASPVRAPWWNDLPPMQATQVHGQTIRYYDMGHGPTLVLLHGLGSSAGFDWGTVIPELAKHYRVLAPDQLGFGQSDKPLINYGPATWVDMLGGFLKDRGVTRFDLAGESLGGWIAGLYTARAADLGYPLPQRLVLVDAGGHPSMKPVAGAPASASVLPVLSIASVREGLSKYVFHDPALVTPAVAEQAFALRLSEGSQYTQDSFRRNLAGSDAVFLDQATLAGLKLPVLVVWGEQDRLVSPAHGADFTAWIPGARRVLIPDAGHAPAVEQPQVFLQAVLPFLQQP
ncbi:Pimeloyl-ACP methyl ester carboxylesterase [Pseudoxanthomonas sp. GM95]|uniref:alpha/beta fold hydrolase n=1 Tax=Pseudoxanthomonas sp. GM95 TaxID=1881043 RepID=UPI0008C4C75D|nr:alpha/beta fold hydrolase [Pseudoxanthomonas sp. GM95]SEL67442.1 Pimeloyl-ACP methyl ester carboxylesterase [Pseudoxanthomonas sp. GM95]